MDGIIHQMVCILLQLQQQEENVILVKFQMEK